MSSNIFQTVIDEQELSEGRPSQRHPLEGHDYHKKSDAQLEYIAKDAHKAAEAMKSHNTDAENKYRDQANDSATVRYWRKKNGMPDWYKKKYGHMKESVELDEGQVTSKILDSGAHSVFYNGQHIGTVHAKEVQWFGGRNTTEISAKYHDGKKVDVNPDNKGRNTLDSAKASLVYHHLKKSKSMKEEVELDEASDSKRPPNFTMHPIDRQDYKILKDPKKKPLPKDSKEWGRDGSEKKIKEETELDEEQDSKHFEIYDTKTSKAVHSFKANHMSHANIKADDWLESNGKTGKGLKVRPVKQGVAEEVELDEAFSDAQIARLKAEYSKISGIDPASASYKQLIALLDKQDKATLQKLADSGIKFISGLARNRVIRMKEEVELDEKTLTPAELKKREEVAKAMEREKPGMPMSKKMAIATAVAKRVAEQNEDSE